MRWYYTIRHFVRRHFADLVVVGGFILLVLVIYLTNFRGDFWISGWDNLHPEFNFGANIKRAWFSAWQEYQGLGLPAGHAHASELSREILLYLFSLLVPVASIRKLYIILMLWSGVVGVYFLIKHFIIRDLNPLFKTAVSSVGALFYLFNLATLSIFYTPYEAFVTQYGILPLMVYSIFYYFKKPNRRAGLFLVAAHLLGAAQFYIPTLFIVYLFLVLVIVVSLAQPGRKQILWKRVVGIISLVVVVNLYWLLPFAYYSLSNIQSQTEAHVNYLYSEDIYLKNLKFGDLKNSALLKGFMFDLVDYQEEGKYDYMLGSWREHLNEPGVAAIGYFFFLLVMIGALKAVRKREYLFLVVLFVIFFSLLAIRAYPFSLLNDFLRKFALFDQVFRNPYTKFANSLILVESILFALGFGVVLDGFRLRFGLGQKKIIGFSILTIFLYQIVYMYPVFRGFFLYPKERVQIPAEYFQLFAFFKGEKSGRIANLPQFTINGWSYYNWGYGGSGFLWYGIKQPVLDRAFDVWQQSNENYYWEVANAIYSRNVRQFNDILEKYQISWLVVDNNIIFPYSARGLYRQELEEMIQRSAEKIALAAKYGNIHIYRVNLANDPQTYVSLADNLAAVGPRGKVGRLDQAYADYGNYIAESSKLIYYPFRSLFTGRKEEDLQFEIEEKDQYYSFIAKIPKEMVGGRLFVPQLAEEEKVPYEVYLGGELVRAEAERSVEGVLEVRVAKMSLGDKILGKQPKSCDKFNQGVYQLDRVERNKEELLRLTSIDSSNCLSISLPQLSQEQGYLVTVKNSHQEGKRLSFMIINNFSLRPEIATYLTQEQGIDSSFFIVPPRDALRLGYTLHFDNISIGEVKTVNDLGRITVQQIPYRLLAGIKVVKGEAIGELVGRQMRGRGLKVEHPNPSLYMVSLKGESIKTLNQSGVTPDSSGRALKQSGDYTLVLGQAYDKGWHAYAVQGWLKRTLPFIFGKPVGEHVLVNNWANGWQLNGSRLKAQGSRSNLEIIIVFLPQYFQYLGFLLLGLIPIVILRQR